MEGLSLIHIYARQTADYLGSEHHEIIINRDMVIQSLEEVIRLLGTWDITTIRASMGMYLLCKAIHEQTDVRVLLTGEISDELFGYKYTDYAPTADAFQQESQKRIRELYMYEVLRADRCISANSIEARVPFGDLDFVRYVMAIDPEKKLNSYGKGKYLPVSYTHLDAEQQHALPAGEPALEQSGHSQEEHDHEHHGQIHDQRGIDAHDGGVLRDAEGRHRDGHAADQHQIEHVGTCLLYTSRCV